MVKDIVAAKLYAKISSEEENLLVFSSETDSAA
jgi:hypothetical protein